MAKKKTPYWDFCKYLMGGTPGGNVTDLSVKNAFRGVKTEADAVEFFIKFSSRLREISRANKRLGFNLDKEAEENGAD